MKHKAQLEYDYNHDVNRLIREIQCGVFEEKPRIYKYAGSIKELIECQLTPFEIDYLMFYLDSNYSWMIKLKEKLLKQKEMWVE